ncbi:MAG: four helix bundle protein [Pseudopedobacter saltans]|uniref:Four helix bundle protein n=1 Tax=Pseudopedobacter saltans TaxID=151895 RepID=A0A2W5H9U4_9SPHI|nr:MAG: four helix bundle protein [Pseudopedobacter saltans]
MRNYKNYQVWQKSHELCLLIYKEIITQFPKEETFALASQLRRAAYSVPLNIVEGCGRNSDKDFVHFLDIALGSAHETEYCILLSRDLGYISLGDFEKINNATNEVKAMLIKLIKSIRNESI